MPKKETGEKAPEQLTEDTEGLTTGPVAQEGLSPKEEEVDLRIQLEKAQAELERLREEAKAHQRTASKKAEELARRQELEDRINGINDRLEVLTAMVSDIVDRSATESLEEAEPRTRRSAEYLKALEEKERERKLQQEKSLRQQWEEKAIEADRLAREVGLDMETSPELETAYLWFRTGDADRGLKKVQEVVAKIKAEKQQPEGKPKETEEELRARIEREIAEKYGLLTPEVARPSASGERVYTLKEIEEMTPQEFAKEFEGKSTLQLILEGKIREK
jgi:hypothetical protein